MGTVTNYTDGLSTVDNSVLTAPGYVYTNYLSVNNNASIGGNLSITGQGNFDNSLTVAGTLITSMVKATSDFEVVMSVPNSPKLIIPNTATGGVQLVGRTDGSLPSTGQVGQIISSFVNSSSAVSLTAGQSTNVTSISLTAGNWLLSGTVIFNCGSATTPYGIYSSISAFSGNTDTDILLGFNQSGLVFNAGTFGYMGIVAPTIQLSLSTTTTYYLKAHADTFGDIMTAFGSIIATRIC
jgi:hypothetical protein